MINQMSGAPFRQRGAVLVVSLIMLAVLTLFVISMIKTSIVELKIGGVSQTAASNLSAADSAIDNFLALNSGRFAPDWLPKAAGAGGPVAGSFAYSTAVTAYSALGASVQLAGVQLSCGAPKRVGEQIGPNSLKAVQFDIWATAIGGTGGRVVTHQGVQSLAPSGSCP